MSLLACCFWWLLLGVLVGWLLSWLFNRLFGRSDVQEVGAPPQAAVAPAEAVPHDDLTVIEGIGPRIAALLRENGIVSYEKLAASDAKSLWTILERGGPRFKLANNPGTWPEQAAYCVRGDWDGLKEWQEELYAGLRVVGAVPSEAEIDVEAARAAGFSLKGADDLEIIEGIGPKIAGLLREHGITTFAHLAAAAPSDLPPSSTSAGRASGSPNPRPGPSRRATASATTGPASRSFKTGSPPAGSEGRPCSSSTEGPRSSGAHSTAGS
jgi:predicted flap endonuclease-1-like 5' DNA nuclease